MQALQHLRTDYVLTGLNISRVYCARYKALASASLLILYLPEIILFRSFNIFFCLDEENLLLFTNLFGIFKEFKFILHLI